MSNVEQLLCMNGGDGETSYATNSLLQKEVMFKAKPMIEESIKELCLDTLPNCLRIADLGCSSGPNILQFISEMIGLDRKEPMFQVFLNDLPGNDFNTIFRSLPEFYEKLEKEKGKHFGPCFIAGMPGSFYGRLFPDHFLHFVHSSYSLHWRSQVPEGLVSESGISLNRGNVYIAKTSPKTVLDAYFQVFERDFTLFLRSRSQEIIPGGQIFLTMIGSDNKAFSTSTDHSYTITELLGITLNDMVQEGLIEEKKLDSFNLPYYAPEEVKRVIEAEGSFNIRRFGTFKVDWDVNNNNKDEKQISRGKFVAKGIRVVSQSILASHFGEEIMDDIFDRFAIKIDNYLEVEKGEYTNIVISMKKK